MALTVGEMNATDKEQEEGREDNQTNHPGDEAQTGSTHGESHTSISGGSAGIDRSEVNSQIGRLENIEKTVQESAQRLAEVKLHMHSAAVSASTEEHTDSHSPTRPSISSLEERRSAVDARIEKLQARHAILGQRIEFAAHDEDPLSIEDANESNSVVLGRLLPSGHLEGLRSSLLCACGRSLGSADGSSHDRRGVAEWRRLLQPFADEAGQLTWRKFREAMLSILPVCVPGDPPQASEAASDLAIHTLFDTLDVRCSDSVLIDELYRFLCTEEVEDYLRELQSSVSLEIHEARSESAGLEAWIRATKYTGGASDAAQSSPVASFQFEVHMGDQPAPSYTPFLTQDKQRLTSAQRQHNWREQTWRQVQTAIARRKVFGRTHSSASELFGSMALCSESASAGSALILYYDDIVEVLRRLGLGFTEATIATLLSDVDVDPDHRTVHLDAFLTLLSPSLDGR